ncbi:MAG: hypothetical protein V3T30_07995 [Thermodesulfobacteriota bacterium]
MSFYTTIQTELKNRHHVICALRELTERGEITSYNLNEEKGTITVDQGGDILLLSLEKTGNFGVAGDARLARNFTRRLTQMYAYAAIKDAMPLDFEIAQETEVAGEIKIILKG